MAALAADLRVRFAVACGTDRATLRAAGFAVRVPRAGMVDRRVAVFFFFAIDWSSSVQVCAIIRPSGRPPIRCRCRWYTSWPPCALQLKISR